MKALISVLLLAPVAALAEVPVITEEAPVAQVVESSTTGATPPSSSDKEVVRRTIKDMTLGALGQCYKTVLDEASRAAVPAPKGKVVVDFSFDSDGQVTQFQFKENRVRPQSESLNTCIESSIRATKFPKLQSQKAGKIVNVFYPFIFDTKTSKK